MEFDFFRNESTQMKMLKTSIPFEWMWKIRRDPHSACRAELQRVFIISWDFWLRHNFFLSGIWYQRTCARLTSLLHRCLQFPFSFVRIKELVFHTCVRHNYFTDAARNSRVNFSKEIILELACKVIAFCILHKTIFRCPNSREQINKIFAHNDAIVVRKMDQTQNNVGSGWVPPATNVHRARHSTYSRLDARKYYARFVLVHPGIPFAFLSAPCLWFRFLSSTRVRFFLRPERNSPEKIKFKCFADNINIKNTLNGNEKKNDEQKASKVMAFWNPLWISIMHLLIASHTQCKNSTDLSRIPTKSYTSLRDWFTANLSVRWRISNVSLSCLHLNFTWFESPVR